jgi:peptide/nickel transport system permease protein
MVMTTWAARQTETGAPPMTVAQGVRWLRGGRLRVPFATLAALGFLALVAIAAVAPDRVWPVNPLSQNLAARLHPPAWMGGDWSHPLGFDDVGRDVLARVVYGARVSVAVGIIAVGIGCTLGTGLGILAGFAGGRLDSIIMMLSDIQLAVPFVLLAIAVVAVLGPNLINLILVIGVGSWANYARVIRSVTLSVREQEFVQAARCLGGSKSRIVLRHILPNLLSTVIVLATLELARAILAESTLSFLGLGVQPPQPSWGVMIFVGTGYLATAWWIAVFPGVALLLVGVAANQVGDWLRDRLDQSLPGQ